MPGKTDQKSLIGSFAVVRESITCFFTITTAKVTPCSLILSLEMPLKILMLVLLGTKLALFKGN